MLLDIIAFQSPDVEALKQWLDALVIATEAAEGKATTTCHHVLTACQLLDEEQAAAADLERQDTVAKNLVPGSVSSLTTETMTDSSSNEDTVVINLHTQAVTMPNVHSLVNIVLDTTSSNYAWWRDNMMLTLMRYALADHIESDDAFLDNPG
jgi:hypothetical protein